MDGSMDPAADVSLLQPLQHLTRLFCSNIMVSSEAAAGAAKLSHLKLLQVFNARPLKPNSVLVFANNEGMLYVKASGHHCRGPNIFFITDVSEKPGCGGVWE